MAKTFDAQSSLKYLLAQTARNELEIYKTHKGEIPKIRQSIIDAFGFAEKAHRGVTRKQGTSPYIEHPVAVARMAAKAGGGRNAIVIALLHDVVEDCGVKLKEIEEKFGKEAAKGLDLVTKPKVVDGKIVFADRPEYWVGKDQSSDANWALRNSRFVERVVKGANADALLVKLFDNLHNLKEIEGLSPKSQRRYLGWIKVFVEITRKTNPELHKRFLNLYKPWRKQIGVIKSQRIKMPRISPESQIALEKINRLIATKTPYGKYRMPQRLRRKYT